jgi:hypothetical protein
MTTCISASLLELCHIETKLASDGVPICPKIAAALAEAKVAVAAAKAVTKIAIGAEKEAEDVCTAAGISLVAFRKREFGFSERDFTANMTPTVAACKKASDASRSAYKEFTASFVFAINAVDAYTEAVASAAPMATKEQADRKFREVGLRNANRLSYLIIHAQKNYGDAVDRARAEVDADLAASVRAEVDAAKAALDILNAAYEAAMADATLKM